MSEEMIYDINDMNVFQLQEYLQVLQDELAQLDKLRPKNESSEEFDLWADEHEELEDLIDDVMDRLDEIAQK